MANLAQVRSRLQKAVIAMAVVDVIAVVFLLSPWARQSVRADELRQLERDLQARASEVVPLRGMDQKVEKARKQIQQFYQERLPTRASDIAQVLGEAASKSNVRLSEVRYTTEDSDAPDLQRLTIEATLSGDYRSVARFINTLEREKMLFVIDGLALAEQQGGNVKLSLRLETHRKVSA